MQHEAQALGRIARIERNVGATCVQDGELGDHHVDRSINAQADADTAAHAACAQEPCQPVDATHQCAIRDHLSGAGDRNVVGAALRLGRDFQVDAGEHRQAPCGLIPLAARLVDLCIGHDGELQHRARRRVFERRDEGVENGLQIGDDPPRVGPAGTLRRDVEALAEIIDRHGKRVVGALGRLQLADACQRGRGGRAAVRVEPGRHAVAEIDQRTEQRQRCRHGAAALRHRERHLFMADEFDQPALRLGERCLRAARAETQAHRQRVHEQANGAVHTFNVQHAARQHAAEHDVVAPAARRQHQAESDVEHRCRRNAFRARGASHALRQRGVKRHAELFHRGSIAMHSDQSERCGRLVHIAEHLAEVGLVFSHRRGERIGHEIAQRQRGREFSVAALEDSLNLVPDDFQRNMVTADVMHQQRQQPARAVGRGRDVRGHHG